MFECWAEIDTLAARAQRVPFFLLSLLACYIENDTMVINHNYIRSTHKCFFIHISMHALVHRYIALSLCLRFVILRLSAFRFVRDKPQSLIIL